MDHLRFCFRISLWGIQLFIYYKNPLTLTFLGLQKYLSTVAVSIYVTLYGSQFYLFLFYIPPTERVLVSKVQLVIGLYWSSEFCVSLAASLYVIPVWVLIWTPFYISYGEKVFDFKKQFVIGFFLFLIFFFVMDGGDWKEGWSRRRFTGFAQHFLRCNSRRTNLFTFENITTSFLELEKWYLYLFWKFDFFDQKSPKVAYTFFVKLGSLSLPKICSYEVQMVYILLLLEKWHYFF